jgi:purine nucleosidase
MNTHHTDDKNRQLLERLTLPEAPVRMLLDTDTYNEIDDQFALSYALLHPQQLLLEAVHAAPFLNSRSHSAADGMHKSLSEIQRILELMSYDRRIEVLAGSEVFLCDSRGDLSLSQASHDLLARSKIGDSPLYVVSIGAPTNIASALLQDPTLAERIVIVWLGGHPIDRGDAREFNLYQDLPASRTLFDSGVPLILVPCRQVAELLATTLPELAANLDTETPIGSYLLKIASEYIDQSPGGSRPIWDLAAIALLVNPSWFETTVVSSPKISDDFRWIETTDRHPIRVVTYLKRDQIMNSLFTTLSRAAKK